jgi:hypothetical protein
VDAVGYTEGVHLMKANGTYYLTYPSGWPEQIAYSTSSSQAKTRVMSTTSQFRRLNGGTP